MGTQSIIAIPDGKSWKGRYVHWDGYPDGVGSALVNIINRDGLAKAIKVLTQEHYGWSTVNAEHSPKVDRGDRFVAVPDYGVAYSHAEHLNEWLSPRTDTWGAAWVYVLTPDGIVVWQSSASDWVKRPEIELKTRR